MVHQARGFRAEAPLRAAEAGCEVTWSFSSYFSMTSGTSLDMVASPSGHQGRRVCDPFFSTTLLNGSNSLIERRNSIRRRHAAAHHGRRFSSAHRNPSFRDRLEAIETSSKVVVPQVFCREDALLRKDTWGSNHTAAVILQRSYLIHKHSHVSPFCALAACCARCAHRTARHHLRRGCEPRLRLTRQLAEKVTERRQLPQPLPAPARAPADRGAVVLE